MSNFEPASQNEIIESMRFPGLLIEHVKYTMDAAKVKEPWFYGYLKPEANDDMILIGKSIREIEKKYQKVLDKPQRDKFVFREE